MRRHYLPHEDDDAQNLARAVWLHNHYFEQLSDAVAAGIAKIL